ncbi:MAG: hypothetical protein AAB631_01985 [Patescibacteria group bacterium]
MNKSIKKRITITSTGKIRRRAMALGHSRTNKNSRQMQRKKNTRGIDITSRVITKHFR